MVQGGGTRITTRATRMRGCTPLGHSRCRVVYGVGFVTSKLLQVPCARCGAVHVPADTEHQARSRVRQLHGDGARAGPAPCEGLTYRPACSEHGHVCSEHGHTCSVCGVLVAAQQPAAVLRPPASMQMSSRLVLASSLAHACVPWWSEFSSSCASWQGRRANAPCAVQVWQPGSRQYTGAQASWSHL